jgi:hypothetical protein
MRCSVILGVVATIVFGATSPANAALMHYHGTMVLELGTLPEIRAVGRGVATVNNSGTAGHLDNIRLKASRMGIGTAGVFVPVTDAAAAPIVGILVTASLGTGTLGPISGGVQSSALTQNVLPVRGLAKVCLFSTACGTALPLLLTQHTGATGTKGVGIGGILTIGGTSPIRISIEAAPWTIKTRTSIDQITTPVGGTVKKYVNRTMKGFAHGPNSNTTSTATVSGVVQLITPMQVVTNLTNGSNQKISLFSWIYIHCIFPVPVPEPGMLTLLGSGIAGLLVLGRQRMGK